MLHVYLSVTGVSANIVMLDGKSPAFEPEFAWGVEAPVAFHLYKAGSTEPLLPDVSQYTWKLAVAKDLNPNTPPDYRIGVSETSVSDNAVVMDIKLDTQEMLDVLGTAPSARRVRAELVGHRDGAEAVCVQFRITAVNRVDSPGDPKALEAYAYSKAEVQTMLADIAATVAGNPAFAALLATKEAMANKTQEIDAVTPSADKYTSEAAVVAHVAGLIPDVPEDISDLTDTTGILAGKVDKVTGYGLSKNDYTDADAAKVGKIELETLAELTGADVTVAPWTQSKWSASGVCSLTASGWAESGRQLAYIVITLAAGSTLSIIDTEEVAEDDALSAAGVYECFLKNVDGKIYFQVISFTEAAS